MIETLKPDTQRFFTLLCTSVTHDMTKLCREHPLEYTQVTMTHIFGRDGPTALDQSLHSPSEDFRAQIIWYLLEIIAAVEMIEDLPLYIRRFPFRKKQVSKLRYLRHHVEFYFHQVYILEEKLTKYLTFIKNEYNESETQQISQSAAYLCKQVKAAFKEVRKTRGVHVHEKSYEDKTMTQLFFLEALAKSSPEPGLRSLHRSFFDSTFQKYQREWASTISENVIAIEKVLDPCFGQLAPCLDLGAGQLLLPQKYK